MFLIEPEIKHLIALTPDSINPGIPLLRDPPGYCENVSLYLAQI